ncbi:IucA/IucC family protein [Brevibacillus sp. GCM10020057]|uniref:IucA/IucC family protein n=1 Tax=Brevibacillus sp. GCM10020057 TaxID=3317327 RepID=UPI00363DA57A
MTQSTMTIGRHLAQTAAIERLLNAFLRERGVFDPTVSADDDKLTNIPAPIVTQLAKEGLPMRLSLPATAVDILGSVTYLSSFGHHRYGGSLWLASKREQIVEQVQQPKELAEALLLELAASAPLQKTGLVDTLLGQLENSVQKTTVYADHSLRTGRDLMQLPFSERFFAAEQSLVFGHPFHPTPKSTQGFTAQDMTKYAPELGASFALHYFACAPQLLKESFLDAGTGDAGWISAEVTEAARQKLPAEKQAYRLLPCHPWQAEHVKSWKVTQDLLRRGVLIDLGQLGGKVYPTSSVRTVWDPTHPYFFKLPLNVRITHFIRVNPLEQLERTMDASRVVASVAERLPYPAFTILREAGYRTIAPQDVTEVERERLTESFAVIFRENPVRLPADTEPPIVIAAALEHPPHGNMPPIMDAIREAAKQYPGVGQRELLQSWLRRYLEISLVPLLWLFVTHGISMESHVQNAMIAFRGGWPAHFYVRDLEGVSISRERAIEQGLFRVCIAPDSPVLYAEEEAWLRFKYYVAVNHVGHLIHTLACYGATSEQELWSVAADVIRSVDFYEQGKAFLADLLESKELPAKANLISSFQQRGEKPLFVKIPNPLAQSRGNV